MLILIVLLPRIYRFYLPPFCYFY